MHRTSLVSASDLDPLGARKFYKNVMTKGRDDEMTKGYNGDKNVAKMHDE